MHAFAKSLAAAALACAAAAPHAEAGILAVSATTVPIELTTTEQAIPLRPNGAKAVTFRTTRANTTVVVTYNAECVATGNSGYVGVWVTIDGVKADPPADVSFAFCAVVNNTVLVPVAATRQQTFKVPAAGLHTVQVIAFRNRASAARLDDSSITIRN